MQRLIEGRRRSPLFFTKYMSIRLHLDKFIWGTLWIAANIGVFMWAFTDERDKPNNLHMKRMLGWSFLAARSGARTLNLNLAVILLPVCRNLITLVRRIPGIEKMIPFEKNIKFHRIVGYTMAVVTAIHGGAHYFNLMKLEKNVKNFDPTSYSKISWAGGTGQIMILCLFLVITSGMASVRRAMFELFIYLHHIVVVIFYAAALTHTLGCLIVYDDGSCYPKTTWRWIIATLGFYLIEVATRIYNACRTSRITKVVKHPSNVFELQFSANMKTRPGEYVFINIPSISRFQWHPFTLTSCADESHHSVHIRVAGDWTESLAQKLKNFNPADDMRIRVDGPYGTSSNAIMQEKAVMLVAGGIGVTPFASILKDIWYAMNQNSSKLKLQKVFFVWICRDASSFEWFQNLLADLERTDARHFLTIRIYFTGKLSADDCANLMMNDSQPVDALTQLQTRTHYGRPNLSILFNEVKNAYSSMTNNVTVHFCGPRPLGHSLRIACHKNSEDKMRFTFHKENF